MQYTAVPGCATSSRSARPSQAVHLDSTQHAAVPGRATLAQHAAVPGSATQADIMRPSQAAQLRVETHGRPRPCIWVRLNTRPSQAAQLRHTMQLSQAAQFRVDNARPSQAVHLDLAQHAAVPGRANRIRTTRGRPRQRNSGEHHAAVPGCTISSRQRTAVPGRASGFDSTRGNEIKTEVILK